MSGTVGNHDTRHAPGVDDVSFRNGTCDEESTGILRLELDFINLTIKVYHRVDNMRSKFCILFVQLEVSFNCSFRNHRCGWRDDGSSSKMTAEYNHGMPPTQTLLVAEVPTSATNNVAVGF